MEADAPVFASYRDFCEATYGRFIKRAESLGTATLVMSEQSAGDGSVQATPDLVIGHIRHGRGTYSADLGHGRFKGGLDRGETLLLAPNTYNSIDCSGRHTVELIAFPYQVTREHFGDDLRLPSDGDFGSLHAGALRNPAFSQMVRALFTVEHYSDAAERMLLEGTITALVALLALEADRRPEPVRHRGGLAGWQLRRVRDALDAVDNRLSLADLAAAASLSPFHFSRAFKQSTGLPPHRYQTVRRVERAKDLLVNSSLSIEDIAMALGYRDQSHLAKVFRRMAGVTPSQYRRDRRT